jgi:DNA-binding transcriptional MocR family regulator
MRRLYAQRRRALVSALNGIFGDSLVLDAPSGGMHVVAPRSLSAVTLLSWTASRFGLLLSFSNIRAEHAEREVRRLHGAIAGHLSKATAGRRGAPRPKKRRTHSPPIEVGA